jgi:hypothetical protein
MKMAQKIGSLIGWGLYWVGGLFGAAIVLLLVGVCALRVAEMFFGEQAILMLSLGGIVLTYWGLLYFVHHMMDQDAERRARYDRTPPTP